MPAETLWILHDTLPAALLNISRQQTSCLSQSCSVLGVWGFAMQVVACSYLLNATSLGKSVHDRISISMCVRNVHVSAAGSVSWRSHSHATPPWSENVTCSFLTISKSCFLLISRIYIVFFSSAGGLFLSARPCSLPRFFSLQGFFGTAYSCVILVVQLSLSQTVVSLSSL